MENLVYFHLHDDTSNCNGFADSCTSYKDYIKLAKKAGHKAIAFSDHGGIYDWIKKKQDCDKAGIKYIHGIEAYMCTTLEADERGFHIGLYAKNWDGVKELNMLVSISTSKGVLEDNTDRHFYYNPRLSLSEIMNTSNNIIITTACLASILWQKKDSQETQLFLDWMSKNSDRCFLEIQYHNHKDQKDYNNLLYSWSQKYGIRLIAGTDTHSSNAYKAECRKILQKSKDSYYGDEDSFDLTWKTYDELVEMFKIQNALPEDVYMEAIHNTIVFADMIEEFKLDKSFKYPNLYGNDVEKIWRDSILKKFNEKKEKGIINTNKLFDYKNRIKEEFDAMTKQGMESFMLFMAELIEWCDENNIPHGDRGSVGGSTIAFITGITDIDPLVWGTVFSRFCNADRISLADIDIDFAPEDRSKVYDFIMKRFTLEKTAFILTLSTLQSRGTIDVLAKGLDYKNLDEVMDIKNQFDKIFDEYFKIIQEEVNLEELDEIEARSVDFDHHDIYYNIIRNNKALTRINKLKGEFEKLKESNKEIFYYFDGIKGTIIAKGSHPAGIIGSPITLADNLGIFYKSGDINQPVSTCSMKAVDSLNYTKFDILGLKNIGVSKDTYNYIGSHYLKAHEIDWNDKNVWDNMITSQVGVFQFEGDFAFSLLKDFKPQYINDMSLCNAALRPSGKSYRDRLIAREINKNPSEQIDKLLKDNYGYLVYQEDTIKFLSEICGFSGSEADTIRRYIGKKMIKELNESLPKILEGYCKNSDKPRDIAEQEAKQFLEIIDNSSEYQFGYNHSTGYSMNGFISTRLRTYYPLEFTTAYLNRAETKQDTINGVNLAKQLGIKIRPIQFGKSLAEYTFDRTENTIYKGIYSIKYCNSQIATELFNLNKEYKYNNFIDLLIDINNKTSLDSRQLKILTGLNFFSQFGKNKMLLQGIELFSNLATRKEIKIKDIDKLNIDEELLKKYSNKTTPKMYKELDMIGYVKEVFQSIENKSMSVKEQAEFEMKYLEYLVTINKKAPESYYIISEFKVFKDKSKPYLSLYQVCTGDIKKTKIKEGKLFSENPFGLFNILKVIKFETQKKSKYINGAWKKSDEDEDILTEWEVY